MTAWLIAAWAWMGGYRAWQGDPRVHIVRSWPGQRITVEERRHDLRQCVRVAGVSARTGETRLVRVRPAKCYPERFWMRISVWGDSYQSEWIEITESEYDAYTVGDELGRPSFPALLRDEEPFWPQDFGSWSGPSGPGGAP